MRRALERPGSPSAALSAVVVSLTIHAFITRDPRVGRMHLDWLKHLPAKRPGGVLGLRRAGERSLVQKTCRTDLESALVEDRWARFGGDESALSLARVGGFLRPGDPALLDAGYAPRHYVLQSSIPHALWLCRRMAREPTLDPGDFQDVLVATGQRLVDLTPLAGPRLPGPADRSRQLGLLGFIVNVQCTLPRMRTISTHLICPNLRAELDGPFTREEAANRAPFRLWLCCMYGFSSPRSEDLARVAANFRATSRILGATAWDAVVGGAFATVSVE